MKVESCSNECTGPLARQSRPIRQDSPAPSQMARPTRVELAVVGVGSVFVLVGLLLLLLGSAGDSLPASVNGFAKSGVGGMAGRGGFADALWLAPAPALAL